MPSTVEVSNDINQIMPTPERFLEVIDPVDAAILAGRNRLKDRMLWEAEQAKSFDDSKERLEPLEKQATPKDEAQQPHRTKLMEMPESITEEEQNRRAALLTTIHQQFLAVDSRFYFKDGAKSLAFKDKGIRLITSLHDERVSQALVAMADAKGWQHITVSGHTDFKRQVWLEGSLRGLVVQGFKPNEQDYHRLQLHQERLRVNTVTQTKSARQKESTHERSEKTSLSSVHQNNDKTPQEFSKRHEKLSNNKISGYYVGEIVDHGSAPYRHDPQEKQSYYVTLKQLNSEKTVWGIDLKRAVKEGRVTVGDKVELRFEGNQPVTVEALKRDKLGKVIGTEMIQTKRNGWNIQKTEQAAVVEALADKIIAEKVVNPTHQALIKAVIHEQLEERRQQGKVPNVHLYDKTASIGLKAIERGFLPLEPTLEQASTQQSTAERSR